jgi:hypothetical protein
VHARAVMENEELEVDDSSMFFDSLEGEVCLPVSGRMYRMHDRMLENELRMSHKQGPNQSVRVDSNSETLEASVFCLQYKDGPNQSVRVDSMSGPLEVDLLSQAVSVHEEGPNQSVRVDSNSETLEASVFCLQNNDGPNQSVRVDSPSGLLGVEQEVLAEQKHTEHVHGEVFEQELLGVEQERLQDVEDQFDYLANLSDEMFGANDEFVRAGEVFERASLSEGVVCAGNEEAIGEDTEEAAGRWEGRHRGADSKTHPDRPEGRHRGADSKTHPDGREAEAGMAEPSIEKVTGGVRILRSVGVELPEELKHARGTTLK